MPIVTDIRQKRAGSSRFEVVIDGAETVELDSLDVSNFALHEGAEISFEQVQLIRAASTEGLAYAAALNFIGVRIRSEREVVSYLERKGYEVDVRHSVLARLLQHGLVSDEAFARSWVANRQALKPRSKRILEHELLSKGVPKEVISIVLADMDDQSQMENLKALIRKKQGLSQYREARKLVAYLGRQGYPYDLIKQALDEPEQIT